MVVRGRARRPTAPRTSCSSTFRRHVEALLAPAVAEVRPAPHRAGDRRRARRHRRAPDLHRDLKPENVLIRSKSPLELRSPIRHRVAVGRDAAPHERGAHDALRRAGSADGVLDAKSDWWSLGMIVLEAASGRHPFDGLTEQVMNHHLATRPIDVRGVYDDELRMLCRGLLLRDPKRRWGADEVARWLAGDPSLSVPDGAEGAATTVRPYRFGKTEATTGAELALALAKHWDAARKDVARGQVARWLEQELHDYNLVRVLRDIQDRKGISDDARLLQFLVAVAPDLPPVWRGAPVSGNAVLAAARAAANDDEEAQGWLDSLYDDNVLATYAANGHDALASIDRRWRDAWTDFAALWEVGAPRRGGVAHAAARRRRRRGEQRGELRRPRVRRDGQADGAAAARDQRPAAARADGNRVRRRAARRSGGRARAGGGPVPVVRRAVGEGAGRHRRRRRRAPPAAAGAGGRDAGGAPARGDGAGAGADVRRGAHRAVRAARGRARAGADRRRGPRVRHRRAPARGAGGASRPSARTCCGWDRSTSTTTRCAAPSRSCRRSRWARSSRSRSPSRRAASTRSSSRRSGSRSAR